MREKYGVDIDPERVKLSEDRLDVLPRCAACNAPLETVANVPKCPKCGTKPYEPPKP